MPRRVPPEVIDGVCSFRPQGEWTLLEAVDLVRNSVVHCREHGHARLCIVATGIHGMEIPSLADRFLMVEEWAEAAQGMVSVALVVEAGYIRDDRFGIKVATDLGLTANVFTDEDEALAWLGAIGERG